LFRVPVKETTNIMAQTFLKQC